MLTSGGSPDVWGGYMTCLLSVTFYMKRKQVLLLFNQPSLRKSSILNYLVEKGEKRSEAQVLYSVLISREAPNWSPFICLLFSFWKGKKNLLLSFG